MAVLQTFQKVLFGMKVVAAFVRQINDNMPENVRQMLLPYLPHLAGMAARGDEQERHDYFAWQTI